MPELDLPSSALTEGQWLDSYYEKSVVQISRFESSQSSNYLAGQSGQSGIKSLNTTRCNSYGWHLLSIITSFMC
jgi:hypothetical protein